MQVFPDYYPEFRCIAERCRHNCCIGWEIDIDEDTLALYQQIDGELGERLKANIALRETPHFRLGADERCPFLNRENLCDLILELGEKSLCQICTDHPRFRNELPDRTEIGVGLCCEAAGSLILGKQNPTHLIGASETDDEIIQIRDEIITILQDRSMSIKERMDKMLSLCNIVFSCEDLSPWAEFFLSLERLEEEWTTLLELLRDEWQTANYVCFDAHMQSRQTEYEQFLVYLIYRHAANAADESDFVARVIFAALGYHILYALGAILWTKTGNFSFDDQVELARHFSAEIEYSDDNLNTVFDELLF